MLSDGFTPEMISLYVKQLDVESIRDLKRTSPYLAGHLTEAQLEDICQKAELKAAKNIASKMLADGFSPEVIAKCVELDTDTIRSLKPSQIT